MIEKIKVDLEQLVNDDDMYIYDVTYKKDNHVFMLIVTIDSNNKEVDLDMCVDATRKINEYLDENNPIEDEYVLEVSSKGIEDSIDTFEELETAVGHYVYLKTYSKIDNRKEFVGDLVEVNENYIIVSCTEKSIEKKYEIELSKIANIRYSVKI